VKYVLIPFDFSAASIGHIGGAANGFSAEQIAAGTSHILHILDRCELTLFTNLKFSYVEALVTYNPLKELSGEDELERVSVNVSKAFQVWPWRTNVPFE
jgi:hypothetical protein